MFRVLLIWCQILGLPLYLWVTLGMPLNIQKPKSPHMINGTKHTPHRLWAEVNDTISNVLRAVPHMHPGTIKPIFVITVMILHVPGTSYSLTHLVDFRRRIFTGKRWSWHS